MECQIADVAMPPQDMSCLMWRNFYAMTDWSLDGVLLKLIRVQGPASMHLFFFYPAGTSSAHHDHRGKRYASEG